MQRTMRRRVLVWAAVALAAAAMAALWLRWGDAIFAASLGGMVC